jgi:ABC-2 type transport system permease protein
MMTGLLRAEWIKLRHLRITWLTPILPAALLMIGGIRTIQSAAESIQLYGITLDDTVIKSFAFPQPMLSGLQFASVLGTLLIVISVTMNVGNEFGFDTWKILLTKRAGRGRFLLVKLAYALVEAAAMLILAPLVFQIVILIMLRSVLNITPPTRFMPGDLAGLGITFLVAWLRLTIAATIGLLATVITRSSSGGIAFAAPWLLGDLLINELSFAGGMWRDLAPYTFNLNLAAFEAYLQGGHAEVSAAHCVVVLLVYTIGFTWLAMIVFRRRDIAG